MMGWVLYRRSSWTIVFFSKVDNVLTVVMSHEWGDLSSQFSTKDLISGWTVCLVNPHYHWMDTHG